MKLALAQINPTIGDFLGNVRKIVDVSLAAQRQGADLVMFPEMAVCGYPPADLLEKSSFLARAQQAIEEIAERVTANHPIAVLCGCPDSSATQFRQTGHEFGDVAARWPGGIHPVEDAATVL